MYQWWTERTNGCHWWPPLKFLPSRGIVYFFTLWNELAQWLILANMMREKCHRASFKFRPQGALHTFAFALGSLPWFENKPGLAWWRMRDHMVNSPAVPTEVILDQPIASQRSHMRELGQDVQRGQRNPKPTTDARLSPAETRRPAQLTPRLMRENKWLLFQATMFGWWLLIQQ